MKTTKIRSSEIEDKKIASLPARPTADAQFGGLGYSATQMKAAFDKLPLFIIERLNRLIDDLEAEEDGIGTAVKTGIYQGHTLSDFFADLGSGEAAVYLKISGESLADVIASILVRLDRLEEGTV